MGTVTTNNYVTRESAIDNPRMVHVVSTSESGFESVGSLAVQFLNRVYGAGDTRTLYLVAKGEVAPPWPLPEVMERCNLAPKGPPAIKPLEWRESTSLSGDVLVATFAGMEWHIPLRRALPLLPPERDKWVAKMKAQAQAEYEAIVRSALA